ncbi:MAG TPA: GntR family transcriptional regulator [Deltaproteobacteria bacterium]|jgi:fatty acid metabolism transcriptional regulator FadR|nr:GntR family transcriptional regulator [Deltaproteobacteria bacterium]HOI06932.1 GntR family transcriptional regulator [Deltaproteobacteria bacterium]
MTVSIFSRPIARNKLSGEIENMLLNGIIKGQLKVGEKLPTERELARELDVNRSTVREALGKLESLDLVEIRHGDGVYVKDYLKSGSLELIRSLIRLDEGQRDNVIKTLLRFRTVIAPEMASLAARNRTDEHLASLEEVIRDDGLSVLEKDLHVHHVIALASTNILYLVLLNFFNKFTEEFAYLYFDDPVNAERSKRFHEDIFGAIRDRNDKKAKRIMEEVMKFAEDAVAAYLKQENHARR